MSKILLLSTSKFLITHPKIFDRPFKNMKMAYITTASKKAIHTDFVEEMRKFFKKENFDYKEIDIDGRSENELRNTLKDFEIVLVEGGNSFYLLKSIRKSGFDKVIKELLPEGLIYMGASAGSYIACPTIEMALWKEKHKDNPEYSSYVTDLTAMSLVLFLLTVHYKSEDKKLLDEKISKSKLPVRTLTNEQAILIIDGNEKLLT